MTTPAPTSDVITTGTTTSPPPVIMNNPAPSQQYFTADQLEAARQQEKDKLYGRLEEQSKALDQFKSQIAELQADKEARDKAVADAARVAEEARKREEEAKLSVEERIRAREAELTSKQAQFTTEMENKFALMQKEQQFLRLQAYIQRRINEEADNIVPELVEFISGETEEEIEASINKVKEKTANIVRGAATLTAPTMPTGVSPTGGPAGPLDNLSGPRQYSKEDISNMTMQQYAAWREQQGISGAGSNRGLFS